MKAIVYHRYGTPDVLQLDDVPTPSPADDEVLVRVRASSINAWDWDLLTGAFVNRITDGFRRPKRAILGADIAGRVEKAGRGVTRFQPGDEVYGDLSGSGWGGFAEFVCASERALALKPSSLTFEQAAAVPQAGVLALQGIRYGGRIEPGQAVLINGAGGGMGTFAVQIAKSFGAEVTGVDSMVKLDAMRSIGADYVIDYTREDFTEIQQRYDLIVDAVARHSIFDYRRALRPNGTYVMVGGSTGRILQVATLGPLLSRTGDKKLALLIHRPNSDDLDSLTELLEAGTIKPTIDRHYPLSDVAEALRYFGEGNVRGKIVVTIEHGGG